MNETETTYLYWIDVTFLGLRGYAKRHPASELEQAVRDGRLKKVSPEKWREIV